ncbi:hypothetical protein NQ315_004339 [Exocentrus adspersus]|uniref:Uncharacterized protein n=1 Tax=Exocentrus adspersus TaxID=1586481 RepID=A0AAV8W7N3_9CUCU|nr:hypothetical protein NQ315_004339 [Exocentrus adspersus]
MAKVLAVLVVVSLMVTIYGLPQNSPEGNRRPGEHQGRPNQRPQEREGRPHITNFSNQKDDRNQHIPPQNPNTNRRTRDTDHEEIKPLNRSQISTLPANINSKDTKTEDSEETLSRQTRSAEEHDHSSEESHEKIKPIPADIKIQPYRPNAGSQHSSEEHNNREARSADKKTKDKNKKL